MKYKFFAFLIVLVLVSCKKKNSSKHNSLNSVTVENYDPLPSWKEGKTKQDIIEFVTSVTDTDSELFIPVQDRIAAFDNDGTLWSEKPYYFQLFFAIYRLKEMAKTQTNLNSEQPYKALLEGDFEKLKNYGEHGLLEIIMATHGNMSTDEFKQYVESWITVAKHPQKQRQFTELVYQPMLELLDFLMYNDFKTYIVSGGGVDFMRPWMPEVYGIPVEQIIGSSLNLEFSNEDDIIMIKRLKSLSFINDKAGKPIAIHNAIGKKPIFTVGNSDGDLEMLQWTDTQDNSFKMYIHHTDEIREWAYDSMSSVGRLKKGLKVANKKLWNIVDMKKDWRTVFPFEMN